MLKFSIIFVAFCMLLAFVLLFSRKNIVSKILIINNFIAQMVCIVVLMSVLFFDVNYVDISFFYVILGSVVAVSFLAFWRNKFENKETK